MQLQGRENGGYLTKCDVSKRDDRYRGNLTKGDMSKGDQKYNFRDKKIEAI